jgi:hypothetical protein
MSERPTFFDMHNRYLDSDSLGGLGRVKLSPGRNELKIKGGRARHKV